MIRYYHEHYHALRNHIVSIAQLVTANTRGGDRTLMPFYGQGILSPAKTQVSPRTKGVTGATAERRGNGEESKGISALPRPLPRYGRGGHAKAVTERDGGSALGTSAQRIGSPAKTPEPIARGAA